MVDFTYDKNRTH